MLRVLQHRWLVLIASGAAAGALVLSAATAIAAPDAAWFERQALRVAIGLGVWALLAWILTRPRFFDHAVGTATPGALGAIRALVCGRLLAMVLAEDLGGLAAIPGSLRRSMGVMEFLFAPLGLDRLVQSGAALDVFQAGVALLLFLATIGWRTRLTVPLGGFGAFLVAGLLRKYSFFWHQDLIALYTVAVLSFTPCGDGFSLDRLIAVARGRAPRDRSPVLYGWARYACWTVIALPYVAAGLSKLRNGGWAWWDGTTMRRALLIDTLNPMQFDWKVSLDLAYLPDTVFTVLGLAAVTGEATYGLVLISPTARLVLPAMMALMHLGIIFMQNILFMDLILLQLIFFDWTKVRKWVGARLDRRWGSLEVLFDGDCVLCRRTVEILRRLDLFERLRFTNFRAHAPADASLSPAALARDMHVIGRGGVFRGFEAYRRLALILPLGWLVAPLLWLPGMSGIGPRVYGRVAAGRSAPLACDAHCRVEHPEPTPPAPRSPRWAPFAVASVAAMLIANVYYQIEFFPVTALQMYSHSHWQSREPLVFYRVLAHRESGDASKTVWDDVVGPYARNARYRGFLWNFYRDPKQADRLQRFMVAVGEAYNRRAPAGERVTQLEAQAWTSAWDDPRAGQMLDRLAVNFPIPADASIARPSAAH